MIPQDFLKVVANEHHVSDTELETLSRALGGETIPAIATNLDVRPEAIRKRLGEVYKKFNITGAGPGKLAKLQHILVSLHHKNQSSSSFSISAEMANDNDATEHPHQDWSQAPDVSIFYGRTEELAKLEQWIEKDKCRLIALLGMVGIGKTALAVKLAKQLEPEFDYVIWRSLRHAPGVNEFIANLIQFLSRRRETYLPDNLDERISRLLEYLKASRCLIVMDNLESILLSGDFAGHYPEEPKYKGYGELLKRVGEELHQSCLIVTSPDKPREVSFLEGETFPVRSLQMQGLNEVDAKEILQAKGLSDESKWGTLINLYRGNPLALKIVSTTVKEVFGGSVTQFIKQRLTLVLRDLRDLIHQEFERLAPLEKEIANWLAIEGQPVWVQDLQTHIWSPVSETELFDAIESLGRRSLIEKNQEGFTLPPIVMVYVINQLVEKMTEELHQMMKSSKIGNLEWLKCYSLKGLQEKENESEEHNSSVIISQINERLSKVVRDKSKLLEQLQQLLTKLQNVSSVEIGYAIGNLQSLVDELQKDTLK